VLRDELSLASAAGALGSIAMTMRSATRSGGPGSFDDDAPAAVEPSRRTWEATNILTVATAMVAAARARTESRGCHRRSDHPEPDPSWVRHLDVTLDATGTISVEDRP
jgi:L-aspartate oxidase